MFKLKLSLLLLVLAVVRPAAAYSPLSFTVTTNAPKISGLTSTLSMKDGSSGILALTFAYNPNGSVLSCSAESTWDGKAATCTGSQKKQNFTVTVKEAGSNTKITLQGAVGASTAKATYKGPKGKLLSTRPVIAMESTFNPVTSVNFTPSANARGKITGTGSISSGYGINETNLPLTGQINQRTKKLSWKLKGKANTLSFSGKETASTWQGNLTGTLRPAAVSQKQTIALLPAGAASRFFGTVSRAPMGLAQSEPLPDVTVLLRSGNESREIKTDAKGGFETSFAIQPNSKVTVDFIKDGYSQTPKVFANVEPGSNIPVNTLLTALENLTLTNNTAVSSDNKLQIANLPTNITSVKGQVFNPVTETSQFPGEFADNAGNMLISSVFAQIEARDKNGKPVTDLTQKTELRMQVPTDTWNTLRDLNPGNNQIDIPLYYYDEKDGQWKRSDTDGWLEDESHNKLPESQLATIKTGSYSGNLYGVGKITHLSYWNIDWPIDTHGCVSGRLLDVNGNPVAGAVVTAKGVSYTGTSSPTTTNSDGSFCIDVMRSEGPGEDVNGNGINGEKTKVALTANYGEHYYKLGNEHEIPVIAASCGQTGCLLLGDIRLTDDLKLAVSRCRITGKVVYSGKTLFGNPTTLQAGAPIAGVWVYGFDPQIDFAQYYAGCFADPQNSCSLFATTDDQGAFTVDTLIMQGVELTGYQYLTPAYDEYEYFIGRYAVNGCPTGPVTIKADRYTIYVPFPEG